MVKSFSLWQKDEQILKMKVTANPHIICSCLQSSIYMSTDECLANRRLGRVGNIIRPLFRGVVQVERGHFT